MLLCCADEARRCQSRLLAGRQAPHDVCQVLIIVLLHPGLGHLQNVWHGGWGISVGTPCPDDWGKIARREQGLLSGDLHAHVPQIIAFDLAVNCAVLQSGSVTSVAYKHGTCVLTDKSAVPGEQGW